MNPPPLPDLIETENRGDDSSLIAHEDAPSISSDTFPDGAVLQEFVNRHRAMLGVLLTPPVGSISPDVRKAQDYVDGLVREMGPLAVHETQGWQRLLVNIYSSDSPNGFVRRLEGYSAEQSQALLDHFDPDGGGRPVYEVGVTVGLLRSVGSEEELRHVLAHELAHFTEGHIDRIGSSLGSQTHEAVADWVAFETVAEKGKNPIAGLNALEQIHRTSGVQEQQTVLEDALSAGGGTHHAEGVRVALAQIKIRQIELAHPHLLALELTPIPDFLRMSVNPRHTNPEAREQELSRGSEFAERCLQSACSGVTADIAIGPIGSAQISEVLHDGLQIITRCESASNSEKLDAVVGFVQLLVESQKSSTLTITPDARWELTRTMAGLLREGGSFEKVLEQIKRPINSSSSDRWETLFEPTILRSLEPLVPRHPEVVALYRELPGKVAEVKGKPARDLGETIRLINAIERFSEAAHPKISERLCEGGIDALRSCLNAREGLPSEGLYALSLLSKVSELSPFGESVHSEILAYASRNRETLLKGLEEALANTDDFDRMWRINRDLLALSRLVPHQPLNPTEEQRLGNAFLDYFRQVSLGIDLQDTGTITVALGEAPQLLRFLTGLADSPQADTNQRSAIRQCLFSNLPSTKLPRRGASSDAVNELATLIQATLTREELLGLMMSQPRTQASSHGHLDREAKFHSLVTPLALVSRDDVASRQLAQEFNFQETRDLISEIGARIVGVYTTIEKAPDRRGNRAGASIPLKLSGEAPRFILDCLNTNQHQAPNLDTWHETVSSLLRLAPNCLQGRPAHREALESHLLEQLEKIEDKSLEEWLRKPHISEILSAKEFAGQLVRLVLSPDGAAVQSDGQYHSWGLSNRLSQIEYSFQLEEKHPVALRLLHEQLAEAIQVQPDQVRIIFQEKPRKRLTHQTSGSMLEIRGLSALVAATRSQAPADQIHMIEYLMGRSELPPSFITELDAELMSKGGHVINLSINDLLEDARKQLVEGDSSLRVLVATSFLAGPSSILSHKEGRDALLNSILRGISEERRDFAQHLAEVLLESHGSCQALAVGFLQARPHERGAPMSEGGTLAQLFLAHGVPGIKFMQYLAFTKEFEEFTDDFEQYQDKADPPTYLEAVKLVSDHFSDQGWPSEWRVKGVKGSGSVNVAIEFFDSFAQESRIISVPRLDIDRRSGVDFRNINRFLDRLTADPRDREKYGYLSGLSKVVEKSVALEFDRKASFEMQQTVQPLYDQTVNGWNVRTVKPLELRKGAIVMEMALGQSAVDVAKNDPESYRGGMKALARVELNALLGIDERTVPWPVPLHANPDFHNGQVFIDPETRTVTLLDYGQAVTISNEERQRGLDLLDFLRRSPDSDLGAAVRSLNAAVGVKIPSADVAAILARSEPMDRFFRTPDMVSQNGGELPLPVVHWMIAIHRQRVLGEEIGQPIDSTLGRVLMVRALWGGLILHNAARLIKNKLEDNSAVN